jgi:aldehyde dehydrogenase (NAD+)
MSSLSIDALIKLQKEYFYSGATQNRHFRISQLKTLKSAILKYEDEIIRACDADMGKPEQETVISEIAIPLSQADYTIKGLKGWMKKEKIKTPLGHWPGKSFIMYEPYGKSLIIAPWNYPFHLAIVPLIGAIAAGNCAVIKPSEVTPNVSEVINRMIGEFYNPEYIAVVQGDADTSRSLLEQSWDFIFFTGSPPIGKKVMEAASRHLTPVVLELGGKSPCIVDRGINLKVAVRRIMQAKYFNNGQTCVAPDYLLVHRDIKSEFIKMTDNVLKEFYGDYTKPSPDLAKIVNERNFNRLINLIDPHKTILGGQNNPDNKFIAPTLIETDNWNEPIMQEEIFGPLFPMITFDQPETIIEEINHQPRPLTLYLYTNNKNFQKRTLRETSSGTVVINDSLVQFAIANLPFGGVDGSGMGKYHGEHSFKVFSHRKSILKKSLWFDVSQRFAPYKLSRKQAARLFRFFSG